MKSARAAVRSILSALILTVFVPAAAHASHYRGGSMSATVSATGIVTVTVETLWRQGAEISLNFPFAGVTSLRLQNGTTGALLNNITVDLGATTVLADTSDPSFQRRRQIITFSLPALGRGTDTYVLYWSSNARIAGIRNAPESQFSLAARINYTGTANGSPAIDSQVVTVVARGFEYSQNLNAVDPDGTPMSYVFLVGAVSPNFGPTTNIPGIAVDSTGQITIPATSTDDLLENTAGNPGGDYVFKIRVTDGSFAYSDRDVLLNAVNTDNVAPVLAGIGNRTVKVGETLTFGVSATDPNPAQIVTLRTSTLPAGATFVKTAGNPATGTFTFVPTAANIGPHTINFEALDNDPLAQLVDSEPVIITVVGNNKAPVLGTVGSRQASVGVPLQFFLTATDPNPSDTLTFSGSFLPAGATVDATSGLFSWTPAPGQANTVFNNVVLSVTDNGAPVLNDTEAISITVGSANKSPSLGPLPDYIFSSPGVPLQMAVRGSDPDAPDTVTLAVNGVPTGGTFTQTPGNPASGLFSWTPAANQGGVFAVTCSATDNGAPNLQDRFTTTYVIAAPGGTPTSVCVSPNAGKISGGTFVTVRGSGFITGMTVTLNGIPVLSPAVVNASTLTFFTPTAVAPGAVDLLVQTLAGTETLTGAFVYHNGPDRPVERLIGIVGPDLSGNITIRGAVGAVAAGGTVGFTFPGAPPILQTATAAADGSFTHVVFAAQAQTSFLVRVSDATGTSPTTVVNAAAPSIAVALVTSAPGGTPGQTRITGAAGAVPARGELVVILPDGTALTTVAGFDGSFSLLVPTAVARTGVLLNAANCVGAVVARMTFVAPNGSPAANAGTDRTLPGQSGGLLVTLDGSLSSDPDGDALTYLWSSPSNSSLGTTAQVDVTLGVGTHVFTLVVTDPSLDSDSATVTITITDTTPPVVTPPVVTVPLNANGNVEATSAAGAIVTYSGQAATDFVDGPLTPTCSAVSGSGFALGPHTVTCSATDAAGNTGTATLTFTVEDKTAPVVTAPVVTTAPNANGNVEATSAAGAVVTYGGQSATDLVDGSVTVSCVPASGSLFARGSTSVVCTATDAVGNSRNVTLTVKVEDTTAPVVTAPVVTVALNANGKVEATGAAGAIVTYSGQSATDLVDGSLTPTCSPVSGSGFALGARTVTCSATDVAGNTGTATLTFTVEDTTKPAVTAPAVTTALNANGKVEATSAAGAVVTYSGQSATDLVSGSVTPTCSPLSGSGFALGPHTVTCSATDAAGNTGTATLTFTVEDKTAPVVTAPVVTVALNANGKVEATSAAGAVVTYSGQSAADLVSGSVTPTCSPVSGSGFGFGAHTVTCSATDAAGNTGTATLTVTVQDSTAPTLSLPAPIIVNATGASGAAVTYTTSATDVVAGATSTSCSPVSGSLFAVGTTTVTCSSTDGHANTRTGTFTVTVNPTGAVTVGPGQTVTFSGGTLGNNLTVNGGTLILTNGTTVGGNLSVTNGSVSIANSTVSGNVNFSGTGTFTLGAGTVVTGQLKLSALPVGSAVNSVCGARIDKNVTLDGNAAPVQFGNPSASCAGNVIDGQVFITNNTAPVQVFGNTISKSLQCSTNTSITGGSNTASSKTGQCSPF